MLRQHLIYQPKDNPDGVVYNTQLLEDDQNWAYLRAMQQQPEDGGEANHQELQELMADFYNLTSGEGLNSYLARKEKAINANATGADGGAANPAAGSGSSESFDNLRSILDADDPRFERLHRDNMRHLERDVAGLSSQMNLAIDNFYARANDTYQNLRYKTALDRESLIAQANTDELCSEHLDIVAAPWQFGGLPGVYSRVPKLIQEHRLLEKLREQLANMKPMELWNEPVEFLPQPSESFFHTIQELLATITSKPLEKMHQDDRNDLVKVQANAISSIFGLAVLSGSFEMIVHALNTVHDFCERSSKDNLTAVFTECKPVLESYLEQIKGVTMEQEAYHALHGDNISGVFGSQIKVYPAFQFTRNNTSIATDGAYIYLLIGQEKHATMYKIGTGMGDTLAGKVYIATRAKKEGNLTWAYCQGKLYMRRAGETIGALQVLDPSDFRVLDELTLDLASQFSQQRELLSKNRNYPLVSDGKHLYAIVMTVEKRERSIKEENKDKADSLGDKKQLEREKRAKEKKEAKEAKAKEKAEKKKENGEDKKEKSGVEKKTNKILEKLHKLQETEAVDFFHGQVYYVTVYKALKFDLVQKKQAKPKQDEMEQIDFLSMTEPELFDMPIVHEMFETFSGFYNIKRCALALQHNDEDIHDAGQWLIEGKDAPFFKAHALKQQESRKKEPMTLEVVQEYILSESVLKTKWDEFTKENCEIGQLGNLLVPEFLECGRWTIKGTQMTFHGQYRGDVANFVFSLDESDLKTRAFLKSDDSALEKASLENSKTKSEGNRGGSSHPVPSYMAPKHRGGPQDEELPPDLKEEISRGLAELDPENTKSIGMESFGNLIAELDLAQEDDADAMEEAFQGLDLDERDEMTHEEFMLIARRLYYKKKMQQDKKKMADIPEEQLESVFDRYKSFNDQLEEYVLSMQDCMGAMRKLKIRLNMREFERMFNEMDENRDRHIDFEEFRRFFGKEPKEKKKKEPTKKRRIHISNMHFFWDSIEWHSFTPQELQEGLHTALLASKKAEIAKKSAEDAEKYELTSEWSLYEDIQLRSSVIHIQAEGGRQLEEGCFYATYDHTMGKFVCMSLTNSYNFFLVDDLSETISQTSRKDGESPATSVDSMTSLTEKTLSLLAWVNERRYSMPWRWTLWSQTFSNALRHLEGDRVFCKELYLSDEDKKAHDEKLQELRTGANIKRIKKRLQIFKEREITRELYRLEQPIANNEQAIAYRAKKVQKERSQKQKQSNASKEQNKNNDESKIDLLAHVDYVLPLEKIYLAQENRKLYAFCNTGNEKVIRLLFNFLKQSPKSEVCYKALFDSFTFADNLLAYHDQGLMNKVREFLMTQVANKETSETIKQYIWRIFVVGWFKFTNTAQHQLQLLSLFTEYSKTAATPTEKIDTNQATPPPRWMDKLLSTQQALTPMQLFNHRFYSTPPAFLFFEMLQISNVERYHVCLKTDELFMPQLVMKDDDKADDSKDQTPDTSSQEQTQSSQQQSLKDNQMINITKLLDTSVLSTTMILDGPERPPVLFRNKWRTSHATYAKNLLDYPQVNQSLSKVPTEYVVLKNLKTESDRENQVPPINECYFAMPLCQILNEEMINFSSDYLKDESLQFLCERYSDQSIEMDAQDATSPQEQKQIWHQHLLSLREANQDARQAFIDQVMKVIEESQDSLEEQNEATAKALVNVLRRLFEDSYAVLKVHNPRQLRSTVDMIGVIEKSLRKMASQTVNLELSDAHLQWLELIKPLLYTVVQNIQCNLGFMMQTELAVIALPLLVSIFDILKQILIKQATYSTEQGEQTQQTLNLLTCLTTQNIEGTDPTSYRVFESVHPMPTGSYSIKENYAVRGAIGYAVEFDPHTIKTNDGNIQLRTSRRTHEIHNPRDISPSRKLTLVGSTLSVKFTSNSNDPKNWGIKMIVKPILGTPQPVLLLKDAVKELDQVKAVAEAANSSPDQVSCPSPAKSQVSLRTQLGLQAKAWLSTLTHVVFVISFMTRGVLDSDLISQQTGNKLSAGVGIFRNFGKSANQLQKELVENEDETLSYALPTDSKDNSERDKPKQGLYQSSGLFDTKKAPTQPAKSTKEAPNQAMGAELEKKQVLEWHLFKSGLTLPQMENKSTDECIREGLRLISDSLLRKEDKTLESLQVYEAPQSGEQKESDVVDQLARKRTSTFMKRMSTLAKTNGEDSSLFQGRKETWSAELTQLLDEAQDGSFLIAKVMAKIRSGLGAEQFGYTIMWSKQSARPYKALWHRLQKIFVAAVLYHSELIGLCPKFVDLSDAKCKSIHATLRDNVPVVMTPEEKMVFHFMHIRTKVDSLLSWMKRRLDGQTYFNETVEATVEIAKKLVGEAHDEHRQQEELKLMRMAEDETIAYNLALKEQQAREKEEVERIKKEQDDVKQRKKSAAKVKTAPVGKQRRGQRSNVQRIAKPIVKAQPKGKGQRESAPAAVNAQSPLVGVSERGDSAGQSSKKENEALDAIETDLAEKPEEIQLLELTSLELSNVKKNIYEKAFEKFEAEFGDKDSESKFLQLCTFFDIDADAESNKSKTMRAIFKNIKRVMINYIDFDIEDMPIPAKFEAKMIRSKNPHEEVANDVLNRLHFLFEVKPSQGYQASVTKQLAVTFASNNDSVGLNEVSYKELADDANIFSSEPQVSEQDRIKHWSQLSSENPKDLMTQDSSMLQAVFVFAKCSRISNLVYLRNLMLDQLYSANFRLFGLQILHQLYEKLSPTVFSRFIKGSISYALPKSTLDQVGTSGEAKTRHLNAISCQLLQNGISGLIDLQDTLNSHEQELSECEKQAEKEKPTITIPAPNSFNDGMQKPAIQVQGQPRGLSSQPSGLFGNFNSRSFGDAGPPSGRHRGPPGGFGGFGEPRRAVDGDMNFMRSHHHMLAQVSQKDLAIAKQNQKKVFFSASKVLEDKRKMVQALNDVRVLLANQYCKDYFLKSLKREANDSSDDRNAMTIETLTKFFRVVIHHVVKDTQESTADDKDCDSPVVQESGPPNPWSQQQPPVQNSGSSNKGQSSSGSKSLGVCLAKASRTILDSILGESQNRSAVQQLLTDTVLAIVVEQLEKVCYEKRPVMGSSDAADAQVVEETLIKIDDCKHKEEYISLLKLFAELTRGSKTSSASSSDDPLVMDSLQKKKVMRSAQLLANMVLHLQVPEVMRIAVKCAKIQLQKVDLKEIQLLKSVDEQSETLNSNDFVQEILRKIGAKITNSEPVQVPAQETSSQSPSTNENGPKDSDSKDLKSAKLENNKDDAGLSLDQILDKQEQESKVEPPSAYSKKEYYVYTNLNCPNEEDFTFVVTALWHWYQQHSYPGLKLVTDPAEITVEAPPEEEKKAEEKKEEDKKEEEKKAEGEESKDKKPSEESDAKKEVDVDMGNLFGEESGEEKKVESSEEKKVEELAKIEEEKKEPDAPEEEKKEPDAPEEKKEPDAPKEEIKEPEAAEEEKKEAAAPEEEKKEAGAPEVAVEEEKKGDEPDAPEEEKKEISEEEAKAKADEEAKKAEEQAKEAALKAEEDAKAKAEQDKLDAIQKEKEQMENAAIEKVLAFLKESCPDFEANEAWIEQIKNLMSKVEEGQKGGKDGEASSKAVDSEKTAESTETKTEFAPSIKDILKHLGGVQKYNQPCQIIKESEETPKKLIELKQILELIIKETFKPPTTKDTDEVKQQRMKEKNFNTLLMAVMDESVKIATLMAQRRSVAIAGPFPLQKAHSLTQILNSAYAKGITSVPLNPFMQAEDQDKKVKFRESEISPKDLLPLTEDKVRVHCGKPQPKQYYTKFTIAIAAKELKVTICEKQTAAELEQDLLKRGKSDSMNFQQQKTGDRGHGGLRWIPMPQPEPITSFKTFVQPMGASIQVVIQELVQLVCSLINDRSSQAALDEVKPLLKRKSTQTKVQTSQQSQELRDGSIQKRFIEAVNIELLQVSDCKSWSKDFDQKQKQLILGYIAVLGGWQPRLATGLLVQVDSDSGSENRAIVTDEGFGKGQISVIHLESDDAKVSQIDSANVKPIYSAEFDLKGAIGHNIDTTSLFKSIMALQKQSIDLEAEQRLLNEENISTQDALFSADFILQMLLKVSLKMPSFNAGESQTMRDLIQVLFEISERGKNDGSGQEGKPQTFWELDLAKKWVNLIDNSQETNTNFYLPREYYKSQHQADIDSDLKVLSDLGMQELIKRTSTSIQEVRFSDVEFIQNKNYYLTGLESRQAGQGSVNAAEMGQTRKIKFYVDNVFPRAADIVSVDAYRGAHQMIQMVIVNIKQMMCMNWKMAMDEFQYTVKGSEIAFPDQRWDWSCLFFDELPVDSWAKAKLKMGNKKVVLEEDEEGDDAKQADDFQKKLGIPLLDKLLELGIDEILVQIKAIEYKRHCVLAEYTDVDTMTKHWLWFPLSALSKVNSQVEPPAISFLPQTVSKKFRNTLQNTSITYARQSLLKIVREMNSDKSEALSMFKMPVENLKLHDIISWALLEKFGASPVIGWMNDMQNVIMPQKAIMPGETDSRSDIEKLEKINEEQAGAEIRRIFDECFDEFASSQFGAAGSTDTGDDSTTGSADAKTKTLDQIKRAFDHLVLKIENEGPQAESQDTVKMFLQLVEECKTSWETLSKQISSEKAVIDICREFESLRQMQSDSQSQATNTLPLHEIMPQKGRNAINTTMMFKRGGTKITPGSRVKFYSDPDQINLLTEIVFTKDQKYDKEPIRLPTGKVWVSIERSMDIDILNDDEIVHSPKLEFAIFQVPKEWTVVCWLTEMITAALLKEGAVKSTAFSLKIFEQFMDAVTTFYTKANAPGLLKSVVLRIIARLVIKVRYVHHQIEKSGAPVPPEQAQKSHLEKLFIKPAFIRTLLDDAKTYMQAEEEDIYNQNKQNVLYPAIVQDAAELLMTIAVPLSQSKTFGAGSELLSTEADKLELPDWTNPLLNVSYFLHFFRGEACLPQNLLDEIFRKTTTKHFNHQLDNVIVIRKLPNTHTRYTRTWIMERILQILEMHQARVIDPQKDIKVMPDEDDPANFHSIVVYIDDFSHLRPNDKDADEGSDSDADETLAPKIVPLYSETDDEKDDSKAEGGDQDKAKEEEEVVRPEMYNCTNTDVCGGFENDIDNSSCVVCETPRPPMEELIEAHKAKLKADKAADKAAAAADVDSDAEEGEPLHHLRLKKLKRDLRHVISHDQRLIALQRLDEAKKDKELEEERKKAEEEEAKRKQAEKTEEEKKKDSEQKEAEEKPKPEAEPEKKPEEEKKAQVDSDASPEEDEQMIDLENLPEDLKERARLLGVDNELIEEGGEMLEIIAMGAVDEVSQRQKAKLDAQAERRKRRKAKEDAKKAAELKSSGTAEATIKLEVSVMKSDTFDGDSKVKETLAQALKARVRAEDATDEFQFSANAKTAIKKIHKLFQTIDIGSLSIPKDIEDKLADYGIRKETMKSNSLEDVIAKMRTIVLTDTLSFFKLLVSQGFDLWMTQACYPVCDIKKAGLQMKDLTDISLLFKVRQLIEQDFCKGRDLSSDLDPNLIRFLSTMDGHSERKDFSAILNRGDTTDEEEAKASKASQEEEKKGGPDEEVKEEEKKEVEEEEEEKKEPEAETKDKEAKAKRKAAKEAKLKKVKAELQKIRLATYLDCWREQSANAKDLKSLSDDQKTKLAQVRSQVHEKPQKNKIFTSWKKWAKNHANDRKLTWEQTLQSQRPIACFNDISVKDTFAGLFEIFDQTQLRFVWAFIRVFNKNFTKAIRFINQTQKAVAVPDKSQPMCISAYLNQAKDIGLQKAKNDLKNLILTRTAIPVDEENTNLPKILFSRIKDASDQVADNTEAVKVKPSFIQAYEQLKNIDITKFRQPKPHGNLPHLAFKAVFKGEDVEGDGGPYRQVFQDWSAELQPVATDTNQDRAKGELLDLFKPCANQTGGEQIGKDRFVINSENTGSIDLQKYYFLGILLGICCRTGVIFSLDMPKMFWKFLTGQRVTIEDVYEVEWRFIRSTQQMLSWTREEFELMSVQTWSTNLADNSMLDLTEDGDGESKQVEFSERFQYVRQCLQARLTQTQHQMSAIRRGICKIIPEGMLNIGNLDDLESWICGSNKPNIDLLRRHTEYPKDNPEYARDSALIKNFWQFLDDISDDDRRKFIIFCWGQQRLPPTDDAFVNSSIVFRIKAHSGKDRRGGNVDMDSLLPTASTCFFHFTLPKYSSLERLMRNILIAVHNDCISMNAEVKNNRFHNEREHSEEEE